VQRKRGKTRFANVDERRFMSWVKDQPCIVCGNDGPSIVHHAEGSTFKNNKVLVGHWFLLPLCVDHDSVITNESRRVFRERFEPQSTLWLKLIDGYSESPPIDVVGAIKDWNR
jgi:hypothetical protein